MRLRQVVLVARDLDTVVADLCAVLGIDVSFNDPGVAFFDLRNAVMPIGDTFLEVVSPLKEDAAADRYLRQHGDGGYMVMVQSDDLDAHRRHFERLGVRTVWNADLDDIRGTHLHPRDTGGAILSVDQPVPASAWRWAGPDWEAKTKTDVVAEITAVELQAPQPSVLARRWAEVLDRPLATTPSGVVRIVLDQGSIRFVPAADGGVERVSGFDVAVTDRPQLQARAQARGFAVFDDRVEGHGVRICLR